MEQRASGAASPVLAERIGEHVLLVTLNRPHKGNAIDVATAQALAAVVERVERDGEIRVAVLTGAGSRCFCAGADLDDIAAGRGDGLSIGEAGLGGFIHAHKTKPWIAALRGMALGGGLELALACDMRVAADDAVLGLPEVRRGLLAGAGGVYRIARALPRALALEMLATGAPISAARAHALGLVNHVLASENVLARALELAELVAANAPLAVQASLAIARDAADLSEAELRPRMDDALLRLAASADAREGLLAFAQKRPPCWSGR
ncbi:MAG: enoyl-CoA hydratase-related protein [Pseudomonadota bacterium]